MDLGKQGTPFLVTGWFGPLELFPVDVFLNKVLFEGKHIIGDSGSWIQDLIELNEKPRRGESSVVRAIINEFKPHRGDTLLTMCITKKLEGQEELILT
jgi:hypothetical protein